MLAPEIWFFAEFVANLWQTILKLKDLTRESDEVPRTLIKFIDSLPEDVWPGPQGMGRLRLPEAPSLGSATGLKICFGETFTFAN